MATSRPRVQMRPHRLHRRNGAPRAGCALSRHMVKCSGTNGLAVQGHRLPRDGQRQHLAALRLRRGHHRAALQNVRTALRVISSGSPGADAHAVKNPLVHCSVSFQSASMSAATAVWPSRPYSLVNNTAPTRICARRTADEMLSPLLAEDFPAPAPRSPCFVQKRNAGVRRGRIHQRRHRSPCGAPHTAAWAQNSSVRQSAHRLWVFMISACQL